MAHIMHSLAPYYNPRRFAARGKLSVYMCLRGCPPADTATALAELDAPRFTKCGKA